MEDLDLLDAEVIGAFDIAENQRQMNGLRAITNGIALKLVKGGQAVADATISRATDSSLPGINSLKKTKSHLDWHADQLSPVMTTLDSQALYAPGDDLKKWVMQAYIDSNSVEEGATYQQAAWDEMWSEIGTELRNLPATLAQTVTQTAGTVVSNAAGGLASGLGVPKWVLVGGVALLVGGVGFGVVKVLLLAVPTLVPAVVKRYVP